MNVTSQLGSPRLLIVAMMSIAFSLLVPAAANADGFLSGFTGNSQFADVAAADGIVNFAVYQNADLDDWTADFGGTIDTAIGPDTNVLTSLGMIDTAAEFVVFWQVVNTNPGGDPNDALKIFKAPLGSEGYTSIGSIDGFVFNEVSDGPVGPSGNEHLGGDPGMDDTPGDGSPSESGASLVTGVGDPFVKDTSGTGGTVAAIDAFGAAFTSLTADVFFLSGVSATILADGFSSVFFMTTNAQGFNYDVGILIEGTPGSAGDVPSPVPEPAAAGSLAMMLLSLGCVYGFVRRRRGLSQALLGN